MKTRITIICITISFFFLILLTACTGSQTTPEITPSPSQTASLTPSPTPSATPTITLTPTPVPTAFGGGGKPRIALIGLEYINGGNFLSLNVGSLGTAPDQIIFTKSIKIADLDDTFWGYPNLPLSWSPDGTYLAYPAMTDGHLAIHLMDRIKSSSELLAEFPEYDSIYAAGKFSWSPDGKFLAFSTSEDFKECLYVINLEEKTVGKVNETNISVYGWSEDGSTIYFQNHGYIKLADTTTMEYSKFDDIWIREAVGGRDDIPDGYSTGFDNYYHQPVYYLYYPDGTVSYMVVPENDPDQAFEVYRFTNGSESNIWISSLPVIPSRDGTRMLMSWYGSDTLLDISGNFSFVISKDEIPYIFDDTLGINHYYGFEWAPDGQSYLAFQDYYVKTINDDGEEQYEFIKDILLIDANTQEVLQTYSLDEYENDFLDFSPCADLSYWDGLSGIDIYWPDEPMSANGFATEQPFAIHTPTPTPTPHPDWSAVEDLEVMDDFSKKVIDQKIWSFSRYPKLNEDPDSKHLETEIDEESGFLNFTSTEERNYYAGLQLSSRELIHNNQGEKLMIVVQADIKLSGFENGFESTSFTLENTVFPWGDSKYYNIGCFLYKQEGVPTLSCGASGEESFTTDIDPSIWHTIRMEFIPSLGIAQYYLDGELLSHVEYDNYKSYLSISSNFQLKLWLNTQNTKGTASFDNIVYETVMLP